MWERFTDPARRVVLLAQQHAAQTQSTSIESVHLLLGLLSVQETTAAQILAEAGLTEEQVRIELAPTKLAVISEKLRLSLTDVEELRRRFHVDAELVRQIEEQVRRKLQAQDEKPDLRFSQDAEQVLVLAADEARRLFKQLKQLKFI